MQLKKFYKIIDGEIKIKWRALSKDNETSETTKEIINGWNLYNENEIQAIFNNEEAII